MRPSGALINKESSTNLPPRTAILPQFLPRLATTQDKAIQREEKHLGNLGVISELLEYQRREKHGCFFVSLAKYRCQTDPDFELPSAENYLEEMRIRYGQFLDGLDVRHGLMLPAFRSILTDFGLTVRDFTLNKDAARLLKGLVESREIKIILSGSIKALETSAYPSPVLFFWHQVGGNNSHWTAKTKLDTDKDLEILKDYTELKYPFECQGVLRLAKRRSRVNLS